MKKLTAITLTYNSEKYLQECMDSVLIASQKLNKTLIEFEHLICDGGSSDKTMSIVMKHPLQSIVLDSPRKGLYPSLDYAIAKATGDCVAYIHSDDFIAPSFFSSLTQHFLEYKKVNKINHIFPCSDVVFVDDNSKPLWTRQQPKVIKYLQKRENLVLHPNCMFDLAVEKSLNYSENNDNTPELDWLHINRLVDLGFDFKRVQGAEYFFRIHGNSTTVKQSSLQRESNISNFTLPSLYTYADKLGVLSAKMYLISHENNKISRIVNRLFKGKRSWG